MGWDLPAIGEKETNKTFVRQHSAQADKISFSFEKNLLNDGFCRDKLMQNLFPLEGAPENVQTGISPISRTFSGISSAVFSTDSNAFSCEFDVCKTKRTAPPAGGAVRSDNPYNTPKNICHDDLQDKMHGFSFVGENAQNQFCRT